MRMYFVVQVIVCILTIGTTWLSAIDFTSWVEFPTDPIYTPYPVASIPDDYFPSVIYNQNSFDGNGAAFLYKMWHQGDAGIALSYSNDGSNWALQGIVVPDTNAFHASVIYDKDGFTAAPYGGTIYHYKMWYWTGSIALAQHQPIYGLTGFMAPPSLPIKFTQSIDGVNWTTPLPVFQDMTFFLADITQPGQYFYQFYGFGQVLYNPAATSTPGQPFSYPYVVFFDSAAAGVAPQTTQEAVGLAYSDDGIFWIRYGSAPVFIPSGNISDWDGLYAYRASVLQIDGIYHMFYSGSNDEVTPFGYAHGIGHASSTDGINWTRSTNNPIFSITDPSEAWRSNRTLAPWVTIRSESNPFTCQSPFMEMWFSGGTNSLSGFTSAAIGYATLACSNAVQSPSLLQWEVTAPAQASCSINVQ